VKVTPNGPDKADLGKPMEAPAAARARETGPARDARRSPPDSGPAGDVRLSSRAEAFLRARPRLDAAPGESRAARVAELRDLVARGRYTVDASLVADAMLRDPGIAAVLGVSSVRP